MGIEARKAAAIGFPVIIVVVTGLFALSYLLTALFGLPPTMYLPLGARVLGGAIVVAGLVTIGWVFRRRHPAAVIGSTYVTLMKLFRRAPLAEKAGRTEPLVIDGPQKYVRSPLYLGVVVMVLGWAMLSGSSFVFVATVVLLVWFGVFLIPFEEKELSVIFGEEWKRYSESTPMLFPFTKRKRTIANHDSDRL